MRKFVVTIDGKNYEVGVEEIGADQTVVSTAPAAVAAPQAAPAPSAPVSGEKVVSPFPGLIKSFWSKKATLSKRTRPSSSSRQ